MSRIGKQPILIPEKTEVTKAGNVLSVKGPLGNLSREFGRNEIEIKIEEGQVVLIPRRTSLFSKALWGTYASHIRNMVKGVHTPFVKKLIVEGVGFKSAVSGNKLEMGLGFSHPVILSIPEDLKVTAEKNVITISGIDKESVGAFTAFVRSQKKPEPYKGKGIRGEKEVIRRKEGKKSAK